MLVYAKPYEEQVKKLFAETAFDMRYKFANLSTFYDEKKIPDSTWEGNHFVSMYKDQVIGYISYSIDRISHAVSGLHIMHFEEKYSYIFGRDVIAAIEDIFVKFRFRKINFTVIIGNPIEQTYDRLVKEAGGRIVGIRKQESMLMDGLIYDMKLYEILRDDYITATAKRRRADEN